MMYFTICRLWQPTSSAALRFGQRHGRLGSDQEMIRSFRRRSTRSANGGRRALGRGPVRSFPARPRPSDTVDETLVLSPIRYPALQRFEKDRREDDRAGGEALPKDFDAGKVQEVAGQR